MMAGGYPPKGFVECSPTHPCTACRIATEKAHAYVSPPLAAPPLCEHTLPAEGTE